PFDGAGHGAYPNPPGTVPPCWRPSTPWRPCSTDRSVPEGANGRAGPAPARGAPGPAFDRGHGCGPVGPFGQLQQNRINRGEPADRAGQVHLFEQFLVGQYRPISAKWPGSLRARLKGEGKYAEVCSGRVVLLFHCCVATFGHKKE